MKNYKQVLQKSLLSAGIASLLVSPLSFSATAKTGAELYQQCSACHLPTGDGVPGAFPPLRNRMAAIANSDEGRAYLIHVINKGLMGQLMIAGQSYMGFMPAQGNIYSAEQLTDLANYLVTELDKDNAVEGWKPYAVEEVKAIQSKSVSAMENSKLRKALVEKYPSLK